LLKRLTLRGYLNEATESSNIALKVNGGAMIVIEEAKNSD
jgi:hypothetical protein